MFSFLTFLVLEYFSFQLVPVGSSLDGVRGSVRHFYSEGQGHWHYVAGWPSHVYRESGICQLNTTLQFCNQTHYILPIKQKHYLHKCTKTLWLDNASTFGHTCMYSFINQIRKWILQFNQRKEKHTGNSTYWLMLKIKSPCNLKITWRQVETWHLHNLDLLGF